MSLDAHHLESLIARFLEDPNGPETSELLSLSRQHPEALESLTEDLRLRRLLKFALIAQDARAFSKEVALKLNPEFDSRAVSRSVIPRLNRLFLAANGSISRTTNWTHLAFSKWSWVALCVVVLAGALLLPLIWQDASTNSIAYVSKAVSPVWNSPNRTWSVGDAVHQDRLSLQSGFTELTFKNGAKVILEGPADFEIRNANQARLLSGNLAAYVPESASGFTIDTPSTRVVDMGTEFCLSVEDDGATELHVIEGKVRASAANRKGHAKDMIDLEQNQARRFGSTKAEVSLEMAADPTRFMRSLPEASTQIANYVHWSFDEGTGTTSASKGQGYPSGQYDARLTALDDGTQGPTWVNGQFGHALEFDGIDDFVSTDFPGIGGHAARTVAFWVKVPKETTVKNCYAMVSWGSYLGEGTTWQISWNSIEADGPIGRLRTGMFHGQIIGNRELRDDRWHHVAVVFYGGKDADVSTHVLLYLDGELEMASRKSILKVKTDITSDEARKVMIGCNASVNARTQRSFKGWIDEVFIFDVPLTDDQIQHLMKHNQYLPRPALAKHDNTSWPFLGTL